MPINEGREIVPRPGKTAIVEFPVTPTGEVDGTVFLKRGEKVREVSNGQLQLIDKDGNIVKEVKSEFDGFYLFDFIPPGRYRIRVAPEQVQRLNLVSVPEQDVEIKWEGTILNGIDYHLERKK